MFRFDGGSGVPIYRQLVQQVRRDVMLGRLQPGAQLPSVKEVVDALADKWLAHRLFEEHGIGSPATWLPGELPERLPFPVLVKARHGFGSRGIYRCADSRELEFFLGYTAHESMVQACCLGEEFSIDVFCDLESRCLNAVPRTMIQSKGGESIRRATIKDWELIEHARHVEVQVLVARRGKGLHFGERECSVQRRHQKLVEETPASCLTPTMRRRLCETAVRGFLRVGYRNAGTAEFLYRDGKVTFNEINARLQVEHPVTEMVTLVDLVRQQILVASGEDPEVSQGEVQGHGHAMECRINAENPDTFVPSPGTITSYHAPGGLGVRVDSAIYQGYAVPPQYDSLIAKLIVHGRTRNECLMRMKRALEEFAIAGIDTTIPMHQRLLKNPDIVNGDYDTHWLERLRGREA